MKSYIGFLLVLACFFQNTASSQPQLWDIYGTSDQPFVNVTADRYESDSLYMKSMNQVFALHQDSIKYLLQRNKSRFGMGFLIGSIVGGVYVNAISQGSDGPFSEMGRGVSTTLGIIIGGSIGGAIGLAQGADTKYQIDRLDSQVKRKLMKRLFPEG